MQNCLWENTQHLFLKNEVTLIFESLRPKGNKGNNKKGREWGGGNAVTRVFGGRIGDGGLQIKLFQCGTLN